MSCAPPESARAQSGSRSGSSRSTIWSGISSRASHASPQACHAGQQRYDWGRQSPVARSPPLPGSADDPARAAHREDDCDCGAVEERAARELLRRLLPQAPRLPHHPGESARDRGPRREMLQEPDRRAGAGRRRQRLPRARCAAGYRRRSGADPRRQSVVSVRRHQRSRGTHRRGRWRLGDHGSVHEGRARALCRADALARLQYPAHHVDSRRAAVGVGGRVRVSRRQFLNAGGTTVLAAAPAIAATAGQPAADASAGSFTDIGGVRVGHFTDTRRPTGCTAILFDKPAAAGADYDGSAPGESLGVMLQPVSPLDHIHGLLLAGGGPMGLGATAGVVRFLEEQRVGYDWGVANVRVPIVVGAIIDDLAIGDGRIRVGPDEAYRACQAATGGAVAEGSVGAGAGATVGKMFVARGMAGMKGGVGSASVRLGDVVVASLVVVNSAGDIVDWRRGTILAGARAPDGRGFARSVEVLRRDLEKPSAANPSPLDAPLRATLLAVVGTNVTLTKTQLTKL